MVSVADTTAVVWLPPEGVDLREASSSRRALGGYLSGPTTTRFTTSPPQLGAVGEIDADIVVDVTNDKNAHTWHLAALRDGKAVVTSNKPPPLAFHYAELTEEAGRRGLPYMFEATVMAGTPVVGLLRDNLLGDSVEEIEAVLNATTTFILSRMEEGLDFEGGP